jgi:hypothetical protein
VPAAYQELVREALISRRLRLFRQAAEYAPPGVRLGLARAKASSYWNQSKRLLADRPTLKWEPVPGAERYIVFVRGLGSDFQIESDPTTETQWTTTTALPRGRTYSWAVEAVKEGRRLHAPAPEAPAAHFKILEGSKSDELVRAKRASSGSHLVMAALYSRYGLTANAEAELRALRAENRKSQVVSRLIKSLTTPRRQ